LVFIKIFNLAALTLIYKSLKNKLQNKNSNI